MTITCVQITNENVDDYVGQRLIDYCASVPVSLRCDVLNQRLPDEESVRRFAADLEAYVMVNESDTMVGLCLTQRITPERVLLRSYSVSDTSRFEEIRDALEVVFVANGFEEAAGKPQGEIRELLLQLPGVEDIGDGLVRLTFS